MKTSYCDFNASTPLRPVVQEVMHAASDCFGNPSSVHRMGQRARGYIERARAQVAQGVGAAIPDVIFTSGGTESNNMVMRHFSVQDTKILVSAIEHPSILESAPGAQQIPVNAEGVIDLTALADLLQVTRLHDTRPICVSVMLVNNETGVIQPLRAVADLTQLYGAHLHCDAVQAVGKMRVDLQDLGVDSLSLSAHKLGGPKGVGALITPHHGQIAPLIYGGGQERGSRAGTENTSAIAGFGAAIEACASDDQSTWTTLRDQLEHDLKSQIPDLQIHGASAPRVGNTSCFSIPSVSRLQQDIGFDLQDVYVGAGAACSSGKNKPSHVLQAMGCSAQMALDATRASFGWSTTPQDMRRVLDTCVALYVKNTKGVLRHV